MRALRLSMVCVVAWAGIAAGNDVTWTLTGPAAVNAGDPVTWEASVTVTGDNQGLAGYAFHIVVGPSPGPSAGGDGIWGTSDDANLADVLLSPAVFVASFSVPGASSSPGDVTDTGSAGGPGMNVLPQVGTNSLRNGELIQVGAGYLSWTAFPGSDGQTAGVGLDAAKAGLLADPQGEYVLNAGTIATDGLAPGTYTVALIPAASRTLRSDLSFAVDQPGFIMQAANGIGSSFEFTIAGADIPGDFNDDNYVDAADLDFFIGCANGPAVPYEAVAGCDEADFDGNGDVSSRDFATFQRCYSGTMPGDPACAD